MRGDRRDFLRRMGLALAGVAIAPETVRTYFDLGQRPWYDGVARLETGPEVLARLLRDFERQLFQCHGIAAHEYGGLRELVLSQTKPLLVLR